MKKGLLITARLKSSRLKLKLLIQLQGREVIRHVIDRAKKVNNVDEIILCTSTDSQDYPLVEIAKQEGIHYFMGDGEDVLKRLKDAATFFNIDHFVSITADNPLFCVYHANRTIETFRDNPTIDYTYIEGLPIGLAVYGLRTHALDIVCKFKNHIDTEIWGLFLNHPDILNVHKISVDSVWQFDSRLTLDQPEDFDFLSAVINKNGKTINEINTLDIKKVIEENRELVSINSFIIQKDVDSELVAAISQLYIESRESLRSDLGHD